MADAVAKPGAGSRNKLDELIRKLREQKRRQGQGVSAIPRRSEDDGPIALSFAQQRLWLLDRLDPGSATYTIAGTLAFEGPLEVTALSRSLDAIVERHEILRTTFGGDGPNQVIHAPAPVPLPRTDLSALDTTTVDLEAEHLARTIAYSPFDLQQGPLLRAHLLDLCGERYHLILALHHIVADGWSLGILLREIATFYQASIERENARTDTQATDGENVLPPLAIQYGDFALWQREYLDSERLEQQLDYWRQQLAGVTVLELPTDRPRPSRVTNHGSTLPVHLSAELTAKLNELAQANEATLYMALLAVFSVLMARWSGQDDIAIGSPIAGRRRTEVEGLIGCFVNTLVLRTDTTGRPSFTEFLARVRKTTLDALAHQDLPFEKIVEELDPQRNTSASPLFQVMLGLQDAPPSVKLGNLSLEVLQIQRDTAKFDLLLDFNRSGEQLAGTLEYNTDLFDEATVGRLMTSFELALEAAVADPDQPVDAWPLMRSDEAARVLAALNPAPATSVVTGTLHQRFGDRAAEQPNAAALVFDQQTIDYGTLAITSRQLAQHLRDWGVGPEVPVALYLDRGPRLATAILGVLEAGGAYVPLDPVYPEERIAFVLADTAAPVIITEAALRDRLPASTAHVVDLDEPLPAATDDPWTLAATGPDNLAYIIYTSGSTGRPKGVGVTHGHVLRLLDATAHWFAFGAEDVWTLFHSYAFDFSVWELWGALTYGARLVVVPYWVSRDPDAFRRLLVEQQVTVLNQTPSAFRQLVHADQETADDDLALRWVIFGGEALEIQSLAPWFARHGDGGDAGSHDRRGPRLVNMYGITETTVHVTYRPIEQRDLTEAVGSYIGEPIPDLSLYLLDGRLEPLPLGVAGELFVGGAGVTRGYLGRPSLTAERFIPNPFATEAGERLYRSGDLARLRPDGEVAYLGRLDHQVQVRGFRIELGEIETNLAHHDAVREAVVLAHADQAGDSDALLTAFLVPADLEAPPAEEALSAFLAPRLPAYMLPSAYVVLDTLPLTANGKTDRADLTRRALARLADGAHAVGAAFAPPLPGPETTLAAIWTELLGVERIGRHDDFFALGGHSLLATRLVAQVRARAGVELPLPQIFETPNLAALAKHIAQLDPDPSVCEHRIVPRETGAPLVMSFAQERLWFLHQLEPTSSAYHISAALRLRGPLGIEALRGGFETIAHRHDALRTVFRNDDGQPIAITAQPEPFALPFDNLLNLADDELAPQVEAHIQRVIHAPFDLTKAPLIRAHLLQTGETEHVLILAMHHIASDGWSLSVFVRELSAAYGALVDGQAPSLAPLPIQYADFAAWQRDWLAAGEMARQVGYWQQHLAGVSVLELPTDRPRPTHASARGNSVEVSLPGDLVARLNTLTRAHGATLYMGLLATFSVVLARWSGQHDIAVGSPIAGRQRPEVEGLIGVFINTLVLRTDLSDRPSFETLLGRVRETTLTAFAHQDVPFEKLVEVLDPRRDSGAPPLVQVMLGLNDMPAAASMLRDVALEQIPIASTTAKFDLHLTFNRRDDGLDGLLEFDVDLFDTPTAERIVASFVTLLEAALDNPTAAFDALPLMSAAERTKVLNGWNQTAVERQHGATLNGLIAARATVNGNADALVWQDTTLSYRELVEQVNRLAHHLRAHGVGGQGGKEPVVGVCLDRTPELVIALLAVLEAGGVYVPLDPAYPAQRLRFILEDTQAAAVITRSSLLDVLPDYDGPTIAVDRDASTIATQSNRPLPSPANAARRLAYLIYTSGSTGRPKGVAIRHDNATALVDWARTVFPAEELRGVLAATSINFDLSIFEIFVTLACGGTLILADNALALPSLPARDRVTLINTVPSAIAELARVRDGIPDSVRAINLAGEPLRRALVRAINEAAPQARVLNLYGPSEDTTYSTFVEVPNDDREPSIGRPIDNTRALLLDVRLEPVPVGVVGELYLAGQGVARGYLDRPSLTAERFVPDPFGTPGADNQAGADRLYRTGDLARWLPNGELAFLGRADHQVKIRGFRVELGEIEARLLGQDPVHECVVMALGVSEDSRLIAFLTPAEAAAKNAETECKRRASTSMPCATSRGYRAARAHGAERLRRARGHAPAAQRQGRSQRAGTAPDSRTRRPCATRVRAATARGRDDLGRHLERATGCRAHWPPCRLLRPRRTLTASHPGHLPHRQRVRHRTAIAAAVRHHHARRACCGRRLQARAWRADCPHAALGGARSGHARETVVRPRAPVVPPAARPHIVGVPHPRGHEASGSTRCRSLAPELRDGGPPSRSAAYRLSCQRR